MVYWFVNGELIHLLTRSNLSLLHPFMNSSFPALSLVFVMISMRVHWTIGVILSRDVSFKTSRLIVVAMECVKLVLEKTLIHVLLIASPLLRLVLLCIENHFHTKMVSERLYLYNSVCSFNMTHWIFSAIYHPLFLCNRPYYWQYSNYISHRIRW